MSNVTLTEATTADIKVIAALANTIWNQHYPAIIGQQQVDYMLNLMYSDASLRQQMEIKRHRFFIVQSNEKTVGFISVNKENPGEWFLNKFYIDQNIAAKGIGSRAFIELKNILTPKKISLTVNRQNFKSINFYFKMGFKIERVANFDIGEGYVMNDFVMVWMEPWELQY